MAHIHEKIDFTASVYIVHDGRVLLHKHKKLGLWLPPGGHIELHEGPTEAAVREVKEETGLDVDLIGNPLAGLPDMPLRSELLPPKFLNRHFFDETRTHEHIDFVYFARAASDAVAPETEDGDMRWLSHRDIEENALGIWPDVRAYALAALRELA